MSPEYHFSQPITITVYGLPSSEARVKKALKHWFVSARSASAQLGRSGSLGVYKTVKKLDVLNEVEKLFQSLSNATLPTAEQPARIVTELLPHQKQGLCWMLDKERSKVHSLSLSSLCCMCVCVCVCVRVCESCALLGAVSFSPIVSSRHYLHSGERFLCGLCGIC